MGGSQTSPQTARQNFPEKTEKQEKTITQSGLKTHAPQQATELQSGAILPPVGSKK